MPSPNQSLIRIAYRNHGLDKVALRIDALLTAGISLTRASATGFWLDDDGNPVPANCLQCISLRPSEPGFCSGQMHVLARVSGVMTPIRPDTSYDYEIILDIYPGKNVLISTAENKEASNG
ncbi:MAG: hypothetical protein AAFY15_13345 [Cyanobacteria bacterium J06648_11]